MRALLCLVKMEVFAQLKWLALAIVGYKVFPMACTRSSALVPQITTVHLVRHFAQSQHVLAMAIAMLAAVIAFAWLDMRDNHRGLNVTSMSMTVLHIHA
jgi:hypothetical protein